MKVEAEAVSSLTPDEAPIRYFPEMNGNNGEAELGPRGYSPR